MATKKNVHEELKKLRSNYLVSQDHHNREIKREKEKIKDSRKVIKLHRLLKKQRKTTFKLETLEATK